MDCVAHGAAKSRTRLGDFHGSAGSSLLRAGFLWFQQAGATLQLHCWGFSLRWLILLQSRPQGAWAQ